MQCERSRRRRVWFARRWSLFCAIRRFLLHWSGVRDWSANHGIFLNWAQTLGEAQLRDHTHTSVHGLDLRRTRKLDELIQRRKMKSIQCPYEESWTQSNSNATKVLACVQSSPPIWPLLDQSWSYFTSFVTRLVEVATVGWKGGCCLGTANTRARTNILGRFVMMNNRVGSQKRCVD